PYDMAARVLGPLMPSNIRTLAGDAALSMSELALSLCGTANGVSALHGEVARDMFPGRGIGHITNGVHHHTWVSAPLGTLFDRALPGWRSDPRILARAGGLPEAGLWDAHSQAKETLLRFMNAETGQGYAPAVLTLGFARRAAAYKRAALLFRDIERLTRICQGKVQFVFAGKAHPRDEAGHRLIQTIVQAGHTLGGKVRVGYVSNYTMWTGALITAGVDVWLNTPLRPHEASGTSGMKAALNGVPSASIADGWWAEGARDNENGWVIGSPERCDDEADAESLYRTLEERVIPTYYDNRSRWVGLMQQAIVTGADFTADRMVREYHSKYYSTL
ncbi:MAG TPA: alpha-glucan family phosphorylase, partial [Myxococcota bacterium]|nr:alpha-glucan family phosphorylase [Myxococcota bacterium]